MSDLIKLGALWIKKDKRGKSYLTGRFSASTRLMIFKNEYKTSDNQPDYEMYLAPIEPAEGAQTPRQTTDDFLDEGASPAPVRNSAPRRDSSASENEDEDATDTRRPQPARAPAPATAPPARATQRPATNGAAPAAARPARNAPAPTGDSDDDLDDPFEN